MPPVANEDDFDDFARLRGARLSAPKSKQPGYAHAGARRKGRRAPATCRASHLRVQYVVVGFWRISPLRGCLHFRRFQEDKQTRAV